MKLITTSDCNLILEGTPEPGLEVLLFNYEEIIVINREEDLKPDTHIHTMDRDGLYQYYVLDVDDKVTDLVEYIQKYKEDPEQDCEVFSICKMRNCLIEKEKSAINSFLKGCSTNSHCDVENKTVNDFLLVSMFLLENLICKGNYKEAIRIINAISTCNVCENTISKTCNCGK